MESFRVTKSVGELRLLRLGNASPSEVEIEQSIGEARVDLSGPWAADADVRIDISIGETNVVLPEGVRIEVDRANVSLGEKRISVPDPESLPDDAPTLRLRLSGSIGELRVSGG
jgi:hypothetical protein